jgi:hypothetical protein
MDSLVKPRPNHYELLGLTPSATDEEIARAFAREISPLTPHAFGDIALLSVAHETLRDPAKRRAYDASLGLKPKPVKPIQGGEYKTTVRLAGPPPAAIETHAPAAPEQAKRAELQPVPAAEPRRDWIPPRPVPLQLRPFQDEPADWKRPAIIAGGIFGGVGLLGVLAGLWAARDVQSKIPADPLEIEAPAEARAAPPEAVPPASTVPAKQASTAPAPRAPDEAAKPKPAAEAEQRAEDVPEITTEQVAALTSQAEEPSASMPLSNAVIARTIRRIGYSCGEVASTSAVEGTAGAFKITCSSGQSYRAAPVRGRYHFRRWDG